MTNSYDLLLIKPSEYLFFSVYFSLHQRNMVYKYKLQRKPIVKEMQFTFSLFSDIDFEKSYFFFQVELKFLFNNF